MKRYKFYPLGSSALTTLAIACVFLFGHITSSAQNISTVAGYGSAGYSGDGGPATSAQITYPWGVAADGSGNFYIGGYWSTSWSARIRKVNSTGTITTCVGTGTPGFSGDGGPATAAQIQWGGGVACDGYGNLYVSDYGNWRIRKVNVSTGIITTIAGNGTAGHTGDGGPATAAAIYNWAYNSIAADAIGNVYFYNWNSYKIRKIDTGGIITTIAGNGTWGFSGDGGPATAAAIGGNVYGVTVDASNNVYFGDWNNCRVRKITAATGIINTYAGNGGTGFSGDGGPATAAQVRPLGIAIDAAGNLNICDYLNQRVRKVNAAGIITTIAGTGTAGFSGDGGPATAAQLYNPYGIGVDPSGNVYIGDYSNVRVRRILNFNRKPVFTAGLTANLVVCQNSTYDSVNTQLTIHDSDAFQMETWTLLSPPSHGVASVTYSTLSTGTFVTPHSCYYTPTTGYSGPDTFAVTVNDGFALDTITIYVTVNPLPGAITGVLSSIAVGGYTTLSSSTSGGTWTSGSTGVATVGGTGVVTGVSSGTASISYTLPTGCFLASTVNVFPYAGTVISTIAGNGTNGFSGDGGQATAAKIYNAFHVAVDAAGNFYIADASNFRVRKVTASGIITTIGGSGTSGFSGDGGPATAANFNYPYGIVVDATGNVYFSDYNNSKIRKISTSGIVTTIAGASGSGFGGDGGPATAALINNPTGMALSAAGDIYFADKSNNRVRRINMSTGVITTVAGVGTSGFSGDGGAATAAQLFNPIGVGFDPSGNMYISDRDNNRIRKVNALGVISTFAGTTSGGFSGDGGAATAAQLNTPEGVAADAFGNIYIGDANNNRVRKVNTSNVISTIAGSTAGYAGDNCTATGSRLNYPAGVVVDGAGRIYVGDHNNYRIRRIFDNRAPSFLGGHVQASSVCMNSIDSLNTLLRITDVEAGQSEAWSVLLGPAHGSLVATYSATSTGGTVTPVGLYYNPTTGYTGPDSVKVIVSDCGVGSDTTVIYINVTPPPSAISGASTVCAGLTTPYTNPITGGVWSSSAPSIASVGGLTGVVTGVSAGVATITYSPGAGCQVTKSITVNASPAPISGNHNICMGVPVTFTDATSSGVWSSSNTAIATIGSSSGVVSGVTTGSATISYVLAGCPATFTVTVNPTVPIITGVTATCVGSPTALFGAGGGVWSSGTTSIAAVDSFTGICTGVSAGLGTISYTLTSTGCSATTIVTVDPLPAPISGPSNVCIGDTITLTDATPGGMWSIYGLGMGVTVDPITGQVVGVSSGSVDIQYALISTSTGCATLFTVSVNAAPAPVTGTATLCVGGTTTLADATPGGTWSSGSTGIATVGTSGVVTGIAVGNATISYSLGSCSATQVVTVSAVTSTITGTAVVCVGLTTTLSAGSGGTWSSGSTGIATVGTSGVVTGIAPGIAVITYTSAAGCTTTRAVTVNSSPGPITGTLAVCAGSGTVLLGNAVSGGTWSSSTPSVATIGSGSGIVTPGGAGITTITYGLGAGCTATAVFTVNALPTALTGSMQVCVSSTTTLSSTPAGGTWTAGGTAATVAPGGIVTGVSAGTSGITYTLGTGCYRTATVTVNPLPSALGGPSTVCQGQTATMTSSTPGGTWSSSSPSVATIGTSGIVTGVAPGTSTITYMLPTGCYRTKVITVNALPSAISGPGTVCEGQNIPLADATPGGTWSSGTTTVATIGTSGIVTGVAFGTSVISYTSGSTGCFTTATVTVNPLPSPITGPSALCVTATIVEVSTPGGTWVSGTPSVATISSGGTITGMSTGTTTISYTLPTGCMATKSVTVSLSPSPISGGSTNLCTGQSVTLTDLVPGGAWISSNTAVGSIGSLSGTVTGLTPGTTTITYSLGSGCTVTTTMTVIASPSAIAGSTNLCAGGTTTLTDPTPGGSWSSSTTSVATISTSGLVTAGSAGTTTISYTIGVTGCSATLPLTVNAAPGVIGGPSTVCAGQSITLTNPTPGGTWSSGSSLVSVAGSSGVVNGLAGGTAIITYAIGTCTATRAVSVSAVAAIGGPAALCVGATATLTDATPGGSWTSSTPAVATISGTGVVNAITMGTTTITYTLASGCTATTTLTVNTAPLPITGVLHACTGQTTTLSDAAGGGTWSCSPSSVATIGSSGIVNGIGAGIATVTYSLGSGCTTTAAVTVTASPAAVTGSTQVCEGATITLADPTPGGTWSSSSTPVATVVPASGIVSGVTAGTATISYTLTTGCSAMTTITVNPVPGAITGTAQVCVGLTTILSNPIPGGTWSSGTTTVATTGTMPGMVNGVAPGTSVITYSLGTGCSATKTVTVNSAPGAITGAMQMCIGSTTTLSNATPGGTWSSADPLTATVSSTGVVTGIALGTAAISYSVGGCPATTTVTVNSLPSPISGVASLCAGASATFIGTPGGGTWSSANPSIAAAGPSSGVITGVAAGTTAISYSLGAGCTVSTIVSINPIPPAISGTPNLCLGSTATLTDIVPGGTWSSSNTAVATIGSTGIVTGVAAGTVTMSYLVTAFGSCPATYNMTVVSVSPQTDMHNLCAWGDTMTIHNADPSGAYSSTLATVLNLGGGAGLVTAYAPGTATITYTLAGSGCSLTTTLTIHPLPGAVSGGFDRMCTGATATLTNTAPGGVWNSSNPAVATVGSTSGFTSALTPGTTRISYTLPTGCTTDTLYTVVSPPSAITGASQVCQGSITTLTDATPGGWWTSSNPTVATVNPTTGSVTGMIAGAVNINYIMAAGCSTTKTMTVNALPVAYAVTGGGNYCAGDIGLHVGLGSSQASISYQLYNGATAVGSPMTGTGSALDFGLQTTAGLYTVQATNTATGCMGSMSGGVTIAIDAAVTPSVTIAATPGTTLCAGTGATFTATGINGGTTPAYQWTVNGSSVGTGTTYSYIPANGDVVAVALSSSAHCATPATVTDAKTMTVKPLLTPVVTITAHPGTSIHTGDYDTLVATVTGGGASPVYQWRVNSAAIAGATSNTFISNTLSNGDTVRCQVTFTDPCGQTGSQWVVVTVTTNGHGVGVHTVAAGDQVTVTPNPTSGELRIRGEIMTDDDHADIEVTNMLGQRVYTGTAQVTNNTIDAGLTLSNVANGMYILNLRTTAGSRVFHIVIEK